MATIEKEVNRLHSALATVYGLKGRYFSVIPCDSGCGPLKVEFQDGALRQKPGLQKNYLGERRQILNWIDADLQQGSIVPINIEQGG